MISGMIIKGIGGFYYVQTENEIYECRARGKFRKEQKKPVVGDQVEISIYETSNQGVIEEIKERATQLIRPPVSNVNQAIVVFAVKNPQPHLMLLDRFLIMAEYEGVDAIICLNKVDLDQTTFEKMRNIYESCGYKVICTSVKENVGIQDLRNQLMDKITVFAGPSGVGKSSLLNAVQPNLSLQTGEISSKNKRGKHTTRHVELLKLQFGGWVLDTPGFSSLNLDYIEEDTLSHLFKEFTEHMKHCKYKGCQHVNEQECGVKKALEEGKVSQSRYESYLQLLKEIKEKRRYR